MKKLLSIILCVALLTGVCAAACADTLKEVLEQVIGPSNAANKEIDKMRVVSELGNCLSNAEEERETFLGYYNFPTGFEKKLINANNIADEAIDAHSIDDEKYQELLKDSGDIAAKTEEIEKAEPDGAKIWNAGEELRQQGYSDEAIDRFLRANAEDVKAVFLEPLHKLKDYLKRIKTKSWLIEKTRET